VFYVTDGDGKPLAADDLRRATVHSVLAALGDLSQVTPSLNGIRAADRTRVPRTVR
jgi:hypothetical protein